MSNSSFWLRVALGSAVVAVLGFAIYRAVARLKWPMTSWVVFFSSRPNLRDQIQNHRSNTQCFSSWRPPGHSAHLSFSVSDFLSLSYHRRQFEASDHIIPHSAMPSFFCLTLSNQAKQLVCLCSMHWYMKNCDCWYPNRCFKMEEMQETVVSSPLLSPHNHLLSVNGEIGEFLYICSVS